jgi:hypothetical protein
MAGSGRHGADPALLAAFLGGATPAEAAEKAGLSVRTARRRLADPEFRARLDAARDEFIAATERGLAEAGSAALIALVALVHEAPPAVRLGAARAILEHGAKSHREHVLAEHVAALARDVAEVQHELRKEG